MFFLNNLPVIRLDNVSTDATAIVILTVDFATGQQRFEIFHETLSPDDIGSIEIKALANLLRPYIERYKQASVTVSIFNEEASTREDFEVMQSRVKIAEEANKYLATHYLTLASRLRATSMRRTEHLYFYGREEEATVIATYDNATQRTFSVAATNYDALRDISHVEVSAARFDSAAARLLHYTVVTNDGNRRITYHVDIFDDQPGAALTFENNFGVEETLYCNGTITTKQSMSRKADYIGGQYLNYYQTETIQQTVDSGRITDAMLPAWRDLVRSTVVYAAKPGSLRRRITLTAEKSETTNDDDALHRMQITFRPSDSIQEETADSLADGIFDPTFDDTFE